MGEFNRRIPEIAHLITSAPESPAPICTRCKSCRYNFRFAASVVQTFAWKRKQSRILSGQQIISELVLGARLRRRLFVWVRFGTGTVPERPDLSTPAAFSRSVFPSLVSLLSSRAQPNQTIRPSFPSLNRLSFPFFFALSCV